jgi:peptidoglycan hydrolase CwlO-like protein
LPYLIVSKEKITERRKIMNFWEKIKKDIRKGIKEGIGIVKEGATVVREKAEELTEEGKKRIKIFDLKTKVQKEISELGGKIYDLSSKVKNPMLDSKVKSAVARIKKLETQIAGLEGKIKIVPKKAARKPAVKSKSK